MTPLSPRELQVISLMLNGFNNKEIALRLGRAVGTIKVHVGSIYIKLDLPREHQWVAKGRCVDLTNLRNAYDKARNSRANVTDVQRRK